MSASSTADTVVLNPPKVISDHLFRSDFYEFKNWSFDFIEENKPGAGYNDCFCIMFVRSGEFLFDLSHQSFHLYNGRVLVDKPDYEFRIKPGAGQCSLFNFTAQFYEELLEDLHLKQALFFSNPNLLSLLLKTNPEIEYLHYQAMRNTRIGKLETDSSVIELVRSVVQLITQLKTLEDDSRLSQKFHLATIERAKEYMNENFGKDISLHEIARYACVSPFHFSRVFKKFTAFTPYQYLLNIRLKHSEMLLKSSSIPVADIAFQSGFTTPEYFATFFRSKYGCSPTAFRKLY